MRPLRQAAGALLLWVMLMVQAAGSDAVQQREIEYLIDSIATLHDARFIRNGTEYDALQAADHLRLKRRSAGSRVASAEDFILYCATGSSTSGQKYRIRFADGRDIEAAVFLRERLAAYRANDRRASAQRAASGECPIHECRLAAVWDRRT